MRTFKLTLAYDGLDFFGWQWQPGCRTVQAVMQDAIQAVTGQRVTAVASGRTDAGVHARGQVVSFDCATRLPVNEFQKALNANLPDDVFVLELVDAPSGFHATRDAVRKRYIYVIQDGPRHDVFCRGFAWYLRRPLDAERMQRAALSLIGTHDFLSFQTSGSERKCTRRTICELSVERSWMETSSRVMIGITADGFLYNMVRNIVGTLVEVGRGRRPEHWPAEVLAARDRRAAGQTAPPQGLFLDRVEFP
ncbi:MAG: tRNA pseudouridine(38-40) synthase TruA [Planctomycetes bacterium]|nr:tRNA pseudouridine(38-40) synthase TruA [Planctomycetota bacterium]